MKIIITNYAEQEIIEFQRENLTAFDIEEQIYIAWRLEPYAIRWKEELYLYKKTYFSYGRAFYLVSIEKENDKIKIFISHPNIFFLGDR